MILRLIVVAAASLFIATSALGGAYMESFSSGSAGWQAPTVNNGGGIGLPAATFGAIGGNSDGYISAQLNQGPDRLYGFQPSDASFFRDLTGLALTTDYQISGAVTGPDNMMVRFYVGTYTSGNNYFVSNDLFSWNPNTDTNWTTHQVDLVAANFVEWPNQAAHSETFDQVIAAPDDIGLVFCGNFTSNSTLGFAGAGTINIDNFGAVDGSAHAIMPEPATLSLLALGGLAAIVRRRGR
jgi:hypothetical protein